MSRSGEARRVESGRVTRPVPPVRRGKSRPALPSLAGRGAYPIDPKEWQRPLLFIAARGVEFAGTALNLVRATGDQRAELRGVSEMSQRAIICLMSLMASTR